MKWLLTSLCLISSTLFADWSNDSAAVKCDEANKIFEIMAISEHSDSRFNIMPEPGFVKLSEGHHTLNCTLEDKKITSRISVFGPQERGECMASGYVLIRDIKDDTGAILVERTSFNQHCIYGPPVIRIKITNISGVIQLEKLCELEECSKKSTN